MCYYYIKLQVGEFELSHASVMAKVSKQLKIWARLRIANLLKEMLQLLVV